MQRNTKVLGIVDSQQQAEAIISSLYRSGFSLRKISALLPDKRDTMDFAHQANIQIPEGAVEGAAGGSIIGGAIGLLAGISLFAIPGLGPLLAAGPLVATLSGVAVGGLTGALVGFGIADVDAKAYEAALRSGGILLAVHVDDPADVRLAAEVLAYGRAHDISATNEVRTNVRAS